MLDATGLARWSKQFGLARPCPRFGLTGEVALTIRPPQDILDVFPFAEPDLSSLQVEVSHELDHVDRWELTVRDLTHRVVASRQFAPRETQPPRTATDLPTTINRLRLSWRMPPLDTWSPENPRLYFLEVSAHIGSATTTRRVRFGWRSFTIENGELRLNGRKIVLRGESDLFQNQGFQFHNPHGLDIRAFHNFAATKAYLGSLKRELGINCIRQHAAIGPKTVFEAADELGLLVLNQSSVWSRGFSHYLAGGETFLAQTTRELATWVRRDRHHPSVVTWGVDNEMLRIGSQRPEACAFFRRLEEVIARLDPTRPRTFDGGAAVLPDVPIYHIHHEENYDVLLRCGAQRTPLIFGEFWIGGRNAERRLTNAYEFVDAADYWREMNRLWARKIIGLRLGGAAGVMPYNFTAQIVTSRDPRRESGSAEPWSESWLSTETGLTFEAAAKASFRHALGPVLVEFGTRQQAFYVDGAGSAKIPVSLRNDGERARQLTLRVFVDERLAETHSRVVAPGEQSEIAVNIASPASRSCTVRVTVSDAAEGELDAAVRRFHFSTRQNRVARSSVRLRYVPNPSVDPYVAALRANGYAPEAWNESEPIEALRGSVLIVAADAAARLQARAGETELRGFVVESPGTFPGWLGTGGIFDLRQSYVHSNHFAPILGRPVELIDLYHPHEALVEDPDHPALASWPERRFTGFDDAEGDLLARGVIVHPGLSLQNIVGDTQNVGAGMNLGRADLSSVAREAGEIGFRPILSSSRREYASLAEVTVGRSRWLVNRLRLGSALGKHPWADALWRDSLAWLAPAPTTASAKPPGVRLFDAAAPLWSETDWADAHTLVLHNLAAASDAFLALIRRDIGQLTVARVESPNHVAIRAGGFFAGSKHHDLLRSPVPFSSALLWPDASAIVGGWGLLATDESFEVTGHAFPWSWQSEYPRHLGYAALHLRRHGRDILVLLDRLDLDSPVISSRYRNVLENLPRARPQSAADVTSSLA
ncbi:MAG: glycoside hydrolase family 2 TIM barrel-domain containing protein [Nocardioides sp.]